MARVTRAAHAEAFEEVTGRPLVRLAATAGRTESEIFFEYLARNGVEASDDLLPKYFEALADSFARRRKLLPEQGQALPGAREALVAVSHLAGVVQTVLTGSIRPNAVAKLRAFGLDSFVDIDVGGFGSDVYPKATLVQVAKNRASEKHGVRFDERSTVLIGDSPRDVEAARIGGARSIAVASGRATSSELQRAGADATLSGLSDTAALIAAIRRITERPR